MITVEVDKADLRRVYSALGKIGNDAPKVICRGIRQQAAQRHNYQIEPEPSILSSPENSREI